MPERFTGLVEIFNTPSGMNVLHPSVTLNGDTGAIFASGVDVNGRISARSQSGRTSILLNGEGGNGHIGGQGVDGALTLRSAADDNRIILHGGGSSITLIDQGGQEAIAFNGGGRTHDSSEE